MDALEQVAIAQEGLKTSLEEGMTWNIVSCDWYQRFKDYVNFDGQPGFQDGQHPGEISNLELVKDEEHSVASNVRQLRRDCIEGLDYLTLPNKHYNLLKEVYGSDVDIEREVIMVGKSDNSMGVAQIELNPIRVNVIVVTSEDEGTDEALKYLPPTNCFHLSRQLSLYSAVQHILDKLNLDPPPPYCEDTNISTVSAPSASSSGESRPTTKMRFWAKTSTTAASASLESSDDFMSSYRSCPAIPTSYIKDKTDFVGDYMFLRGLDEKIVDPSKESDFDDMILENAVEMTNKTLDLVIEVGALTNNIMTWPRDNQLFHWTTKLVSGDLMGASDKYGGWFEAVVEEVLPNAMIVHFKGWSKKFNERIEAKEYKHRLAPLYTMTENWREALKKGSEVDFTKKVENDGSKWLPGIVTEVDSAFETVSVKYKQSDGVIGQQTDLELDTEQMCPRRTHVTNEDWNFHSLVPASSTSKYVSATATVTSSAVRTTQHHQYTSSYYNRPSIGHQSGTPVVTGAVGLSNLGNTCFMNTTLQCLSNTPSLTQLFREDRHLSQVNYDNVLGHKGQLAIVYGKLMKDMWSDKYTSVRPEEFKRNIGEFAPQFSGYQQHDSSELMMFLLDGLHEDMNRVLKKPATEKIESKGRPDELISAESWRRYLLRNDSELVDLCFGQLKSHVTCVGCGYESVTFDEYSSLSLPLPMKKTQSFTIIVYPLPLGTRPFKISLEANKDSSASDLLRMVSAHPLYKKSVESRKYSELGKRKKENDSSYLLVDSDTLDTEKQMDVDGGQLEASVKVSHSYSDIETLGDISIETDHDEAAVVVNKSYTPGGDTLSPSEKTFFHLCALATTAGTDNYRILKTYDAKSSIHHSTEMLAAYEMPQEVSTSLHAYSSYTSTSYYGSSLKPNATPSSTFACFDLLVGVEKSQPARPANAYSMNPAYSGGYNCNRVTGFNTSGNPIRITYEKNVTTREEMNRIIFDAIKVAYDLPEAYTPARLPYTLHSTSSYANISKGVVNLTDDNREKPFTILSYDCLLCCWDAKALGSEDANTDSSGDDANDEDGVSVSAVEVEVTPNIDPAMVSRWLEDGINSTCEGKNGRGKEQKGGLDVMQCFDKFIEREQMPEEETWYCPKCKQHLAPIKKFDIWSAPEILVVHLKRFQYSSRSSFTYREKVNDLVDFPLEGLDLSNYVKSAQSSNETTPAVYDLYGVSEHSGTMGGGHYTAKCKNPIDGKWYSFNDAFVRECTAESAISEEAYVLFYRRRHGHLKWGGLIPSAVPLEN